MGCTVILLVVLVPLVSSSPVDDILDLIDDNDNDVFSEFQQTNITNSSSHSLTISKIANAGNEKGHNRTTLSLLPFTYNNIIPQTIKKVSKYLQLFKFDKFSNLHCCLCF